MKRTFAGVKSETQRASQEELDYLELGWSLTCDLIGISDQIKVLLTLLLLCVLSFLVFERTFTRARCVYYSVDNLPWLLQMCSVVQLYWKRSCWKKKGSGGCLYLWKTDTHCVCFMPFCPPPKRHRSSSSSEWVRRCGAAASLRALTEGGWLSMIESSCCESARRGPVQSICIAK